MSNNNNNNNNNNKLPGLIDPDRLIEEFTRRFGNAFSLRLPGVTRSDEAFYGVPIFMYPRGLIGQYITHTVDFDAGTSREYWSIEYGWTTLYAEYNDHTILPAVVLGVPTNPFMARDPNTITRFVIDEVRLGQVRVPRDAIVNIDGVGTGQDFIMVIDEFGVLGARRDTARRLAEVMSLNNELQRTIYRQEAVIQELQSMVEGLRSQVNEKNSIIARLNTTYQRLMIEVSEFEREVLRLRTELRTKTHEAQSLEEVNKIQEGFAQSLTKLLSDLALTIGNLKTTLSGEKTEEEAGEQ